MTLTPRDRRALAMLTVSAILSAVVYFWPSSSSVPRVVPSADSITTAQQRLARLREIAAMVPQKEEILKTVAAELARREAGLIQADTGPQARAHLLEVLRRLCASEAIEVKTAELGAIVPLGDAYGSVNVAVQMECRIEQLVNLLAAVAAQRELISTTDLRVTAPSDSKEKLIGVRIGVSGVVPRKLVPDKKGAAGL